MLSIGSCPEGFLYKEGVTSNASLRTAGKLGRQECADVCSEDVQCSSFVHSQAEMICDLNKELEPIAKGTYKDYVFCSKDGTT